MQRMEKIVKSSTASYMIGPAEKEIIQTEPVQVIVLILAEAPKTTPETLPICLLVEIPKGFSGP